MGEGSQKKTHKAKKQKQNKTKKRQKKKQKQKKYNEDCNQSESAARKTGAEGEIQKQENQA